MQLIRDISGSVDAHTQRDAKRHNPFAAKVKVSKTHTLFLFNHYIFLQLLLGRLVLTETFGNENIKNKTNKNQIMLLQ